MIKDYFFLAIKNLRKRGLRSWLTMLGIFIGIAAVVSLISLGQGLQNFVNEQFQVLGADKITIMGKAGPIASPIASELSSKPLTEHDLDLIKNIRGVEEATPILIKSLSLTFRKETKGILVSGIEPESYQETLGKTYEIEEGRDFRATDTKKLIIGYDLANKDFETKIEVGDKILIKEEQFEVIGIMKKVGSSDDSSAIIPLEQLRILSDEPQIISMIIVKVSSGSDVNQVASDIEAQMKRDRLEKRDKEPETFNVQTAEQLLETFGSILTAVQAVLIGIAAISLLVGGIGIMNTMYTSVLERRKEIGIMKAIGAKNSDILLIFLFESGLLGLAGGAIGIFLGISLGKLAEFIAYNALDSNIIQASFPWYLILGALSFSVIIGTLSGILPAMQASRLKPIDALRYE